MQRLGVISVLALVCGMAACQPAEERISFPDEGFSITPLGDGWTQSRERGSIVFSGPARAGLSKASLVIRAVPLSDASAKRRDTKRVLPATAYVLGQLPKAHVTIGKSIRRSGLRGKTWHVQFVPPGKTTMYERRHAALVGRNRVFHVFVTAPAGQLGAAQAEFDAAVSSIREGA